MRRAVATYPALDAPLLLMGMPPAPFLAATIVAVLSPVVGGFLWPAFLPTVLYPAALSGLRHIGRQDPKRVRVLAEHLLFFRRFHHPVGLVHARGARRINRRSLLP